MSWSRLTRSGTPAGAGLGALPPAGRGAEPRHFFLTLLVLLASPAYAQVPAPTPLLPPPLPPNAAPVAPVPSPAPTLPSSAPPVTPPAGTQSASPQSASAQSASAQAPPAAPPPGFSASGQPLPTPTPAPPAPTWQAGHTAVIQVLDKVNGQATDLSVPVGGAQTDRTLTVAVRACYSRPPDQPEDSTALLAVTEASATAPVFTGWMLASEPTASMLTDPVYDLRVLSCR